MKRVVFLVGLLLSQLYLTGQYFPVKQYTTYDGMPSSSIYDIDQAPDGMMWFLSGYGPVYYDTKTWVSFPDSLNLPSSPNARLSIHENGEVFTAGFTGSSFVVHRYAADAWYSIPTPADFYEIKEKVFGFSSLLADDMGVLALCNQNKLYILQANTLEWETLSFGSDTTIHNIVTTNDAKQWVTTSHGLYLLADNELSRVEIDYQRLPNSEIQNIARYDYDSSLYLLGDQWLAKYNQDSIQVISTSVPHNPALKRLDKSNLVVDKRGMLFTGSNVPAHFLDEQSGEWKKILIEGLELNINSTKIFCDKENNLWVGDSRGLFKFNLLQFTNFNKNTGLGENEVCAITELSDGTIILANPHYLNSYQNGKITNHIINPDLSQNYRVLDLLEDPVNQHLYVATSYGGLLVYEIGNYSKPIRTFKSKYGYVSAEMYNNEIYAATSAEIQRISDFKVDIIKSQSTYIRNLNIIENQLAISSGRNGLEIFDSEDFMHFSSETYGLNNVYKAEYYNGHILIGTKNGIGILNQNQIMQWDAFPSQIPVYSLLNVRDQQLWIGTNQGVFMYDGKKLTQYGKPQGLVGIEINRNAFFEDSKGNIWVGTEKGASLFQSSRANIPYYLADVKLISAKASDDKVLSFRQINNLNFNQNTVTIYYQCLSYVREQDLQIRYQLFDPRNPEQAVWENINNNASSELRFSNLSPGPYVFRMQAKNQGYDWGEVKEIMWEIEQPFYNQLWFILMSGMLAMAVLGMIFRMRYTYLIKRQQRLEKLVNQRTAEIQELNDNLEDKVEERTRLLRERNEQLREYAFLNAHLLRNPLTKIMSTLLLIRENEVKQIDNRLLSMMEDSVSELDGVIHTINDKISDDNPNTQ